MALSRLPWWVCLVVGLVGYMVLHAHATQPLPPVDPKQMQGLMVGAMTRGLATGAQYILPIICVIAAVVSFVGSAKRRDLVRAVAGPGASSAAAIDAMTWQEFELLIGEAFRLQGFTVTEQGGASADGGVDLELQKGSERWLVQCKHWRALKVPVNVVRELAGVMAHRRAVGAYVVTSGTFTSDAESFAEGRGIVLVNGSKLQGLIAQARTSLDKRTVRTASRPAATPLPSLPSMGVPTLPACPVCSRSMALRKARKGPNAGGAFWGCTSFPGCRGTRPA